MMSRDEFEQIDQPDNISRQDEVLLKFLQGKTGNEIAKELYIAPATVRKHIQLISEKFGLKVKGKPGYHRPALMRLFAEYKPELLITDKSAKGQQRIVIIYWNQKDPSYILAKELEEKLTNIGQHIFLTRAYSSESDRLDRHESLLVAQIKLADYLIMIMNRDATLREMTLNTVENAWKIRDISPQKKPNLLPILVDFNWSDMNGNKLQMFLRETPRQQWMSGTETQPLIENIINQIQQNTTNVAPLISELATISPLNYPPIPEVNPEVTGGQVRLDSAYYVERFGIDQSCYEHILTPGALIRIKGPRQMGKTSLMTRILDKAKTAGYQTIALSCQQAGSQAFTNLDTFLRWFCEQVGRPLKQLENIDAYWNVSIINDRCHYYFQECLLPEIETGLVIALDESDALFDHLDIAKDFFGLLRFWFEKARYNDGVSSLWEKLRLVIVHSTEVYVKLPVNQSPFNVGQSIELLEFNQSEIKDLLQRYQGQFYLDQLGPLLAIVGGHPFLLRLALYYLQSHTKSLDEICQNAATDAGIYSDHLQRHWAILQEFPQLLEAFYLVVHSDTPIPLKQELMFKLKSMGLINLVNNLVTVRYSLYRSYFQEKFSHD